MNDQINNTVVIHCFYRTCLLPVIAVHAALSLTELKDVERLPSVYYHW
jgi:hypothetical protein